MMKRALFIASLFGIGVSGCGESGPSLVSVSGVVTLNGKPFPDAVVSFLPDPSNKDGRPAEDKTGPEGNYKAMTSGRSGIVPGKYHVVITKSPSTEAPSGTSEAFKDDPFMANLSTPPVTKGKTDAIPANAETAFDRDVPAGGTVLDFDVKAKSSAAK